MVTSKINGAECTKVITYPWLGVNKHTRQVVLFSGEYKGTMIEKGISYDVIGYYSNNWVMSSFSPFSGSVTLQNS